MAERIVSPGVFTREKDVSFLPQGIGEIGAAIIGPTVKGPAFVPTNITSYSEFENAFGKVDTRYYVPYTVKEYLENGNIKNSVNFPAAEMEMHNEARILIANKNVPNMVSQISTVLAAEGINIENMLNKKRDNIAYNIIDVDKPKINETIKEKLLSIDGIFMVRIIQAK